MDSLYVTLHQMQNSNNNLQYISFIIALLAVFFSPLISYLTTKQTIKSQTIASKEQIAVQSRISEQHIKSDIISRNRQEWINTLRANISEFISLCVVISKMTTTSAEPIDDKWERLFMLRAKLSLLINSKEEDHQQLDGLFEKAIRNVLDKNEVGFGDLRRKIIALTQQILKREWERVKQIE